MPRKHRSGPKKAWGLFPAVLVYLFGTTVYMLLLSHHLMPLGRPAVVRTAGYFHLAMAVATHGLLRFIITAPFGRHAKGSLVHITLPAPLSWVLQECPTVMNVIYYILLEYPCYSLGCSGSEWLRLLLEDPFGRATQVILGGFLSLHIGLLLFVIHYTHRSFLYPLRIRHGTPVPIHITISATLYCTFNGRLQLLANVRDAESASYFPFSSGTYMILFLLGVVCFVFGMWVNVSSDYYLVRLKQQPPRCTYKIPRGGLFTYVSCANFFGEIVEFCGYTLVVFSTTAASKTEGGLAACSFLLYVLANLLPRGYAHHEWYKKQFGCTYEALGRTAVLPYLY